MQIFSMVSPRFISYGFWGVLLLMEKMAFTMALSRPSSLLYCCCVGGGGERFADEDEVVVGDDMDDDMTGITTSNPTLPEVMGGVVAVVLFAVDVVLVFVLVLLLLSGDMLDLLYDLLVLLSCGLGGAGLG